MVLSSAEESFPSLSPLNCMAEDEESVDALNGESCVVVWLAAPCSLARALEVVCKDLEEYTGQLQVGEVRVLCQAMEELVQADDDDMD